MARTRPEEWALSGVEGLEDAAWKALRATRSTCVIAGPGAGKTELLAQRVTYLLETGTCPAPSRILAISYKRDAAYNLRSRVEQRCPSRLSRRFSSVTFDSFAKSIVDRFANSLPPRWQLANGYEVDFPETSDFASFLDTMCSRRSRWRQEIRAMSPKSFEGQVLGRWPLSAERREFTSAEEFVAVWWWCKRVYERRPEPAALSFTMINRLAELIVRHSPVIRRALRCTYPFVFVDECQDTTYAQYDFLRTVFGEGICVTAVGDNKQRIMDWAGAVPDVFSAIEQDFGAARIPLRCNYRSSPELVRVQHVLARRLDQEALPALSRREPAIDGNVAQVWLLDSRAEEARQIARLIDADRTQRSLRPRDYGLLVRQQADTFEPLLAEELANVGLHIRNEARRVGRTTVQDLLVDSLATLYLRLLRLASQERDPEAWTAVTDAVRSLRGVYSHEQSGATRTADRQLSTFVGRLRGMLRRVPVDAAGCPEVLESLDEFVDLTALAQVIPEYRAPDAISIAREAMQIHLECSTHAVTTWSAALDAFEGTDCVPLMTVHKSKGLEFDTMFLVGLDDKTWWSYSPDNPEGHATFFVALSRAMQRVVITHCSERGGRDKVAPLFGVLQEVGAPTADFRSAPLA